MVALNREGIMVGRCRVERLMPALGLVGAVRGKAVRTTVPDPDVEYETLYELGDLISLVA